MTSFSYYNLPLVDAALAGFLQQAARTGQGKFGDPLPCKHPQGAEVCGKDRPDPHQSGR